MKWSRNTLYSIACMVLLLQFHCGFSSPSSCGDGEDSAEHSAAPWSPKPHHHSKPPAKTSSSPLVSSSDFGSSSSSSSGVGSRSSSVHCDCSAVSSLDLGSFVDNASVSADDSSFAFDDTTSDIARQLYLRYEAGDEIDRIQLASVPNVLRSRLENVSLAFEDLPGLMQRAVLWDSGFIVTSDKRAVQVWTLDNRSMADIAVSRQEFTAAGCESTSCPQPDNSTGYIYSTCKRGPAEILAASKCVVEAFEDDGDSTEVVWAAAGDPTSLPEIRASKSTGVTECSCNYTVYSIHMGSGDSEAVAGQCPDDGFNSLIIPCYGNDSIPESVRTRFTAPKATDWVTGWIIQFKQSETTAESSGSKSHGSSSATTGSGEDSDGGGLSWWWLLIILLIVLLIIIATVFACRHCKKLSQMPAQPDNTTYIFVGGRMWAVQEENSGRGAKYWLRFANWCRKTFSFFN